MILALFAVLAAVVAILLCRLNKRSTDPRARCKDEIATRTPRPGVGCDLALSSCVYPVPEPTPYEYVAAPPPARCLPAVRSRLALGPGAPHTVGSMDSGTLRAQLGKPVSPSEGATAPAPCGSSGMIAGA